MKLYYLKCHKILLCKIFNVILIKKNYNYNYFILFIYFFFHNLLKNE